ncbi:MAG: DUF364 domain-containing protein [Syntrophobacteria bacterium]|jgi:hypothetical protein
MEILQELLESLKIDLPVTAGVVGSHLIAVASQRLGLAAHLHSQGQSDVVVSEQGVGTLIGRRARDLAYWVLEDHWVRAGIGMAALNSVLEIDYQALLEVNAKQIIAERAIGKNLMVVGHFPFIGQLRSKVRNLWVMEKEPRSGDLSEEEGYQALAGADVVAITASCLINHTFDRIMANCKPGSFKIMLGPSTPLSTILLDCGLDVIGGALVEEESVVLRMVENGAAFRQLKGVRTVVMTKDTL